MIYEVTIRYTGTTNFIVEADSTEEAEEKAAQCFGNGEPGAIFGNEYEVIQSRSASVIFPKEGEAA